MISVFDGAVDTIRLTEPLMTTVLPERSVNSLPLVSLHPNTNSVSINSIGINDITFGFNAFNLLTPYCIA